jgi:hypothetical protein
MKNENENVKRKIMAAASMARGGGKQANWRRRRRQRWATSGGSMAKNISNIGRHQRRKSINENERAHGSGVAASGGIGGGGSVWQHGSSMAAITGDGDGMATITSWRQRKRQQRNRRISNVRQRRKATTAHQRRLAPLRCALPPLRVFLRALRSRA